MKVRIVYPSPCSINSDTGLANNSPMGMNGAGDEQAEGPGVVGALFASPARLRREEDMRTRSSIHP